MAIFQGKVGVFIVGARNECAGFVVVISGQGSQAILFAAQGAELKSIGIRSEMIWIWMMNDGFTLMDYFVIIITRHISFCGCFRSK